MDTGFLPNWVRIILLFVFLVLIAVQTWLVLYMESKMAEREGTYSKRKHPKESSETK
jgi:hypothetical protein